MSFAFQDRYFIRRSVQYLKFWYYQSFLSYFWAKFLESFSFYWNYNYAEKYEILVGYSRATLQYNSTYSRYRDLAWNSGILDRGVSFNSRDIAVIKRFPTIVSVSINQSRLVRCCTLRRRSLIDKCKGLVRADRIA